MAVNSSMYRFVQYVHSVKFSFYEYWILYKCINYLLNGQMIWHWKKYVETSNKEIFGNRLFHAPLR